VSAGRRALASGRIAASPQTLFALLDDLAEHWRMAGDWVEVVSLDPPTGPAQGAVVRLRGPLGLRRTARTRVDVAEPDTRLAGHAQTANGTRAAVEWNLRPAGTGTRVDLCVALAGARLGDRLLWAVIGRAWTQRRLAATLERLAAWAAADAGRWRAPRTPSERDGDQL
jgi:hypothetical protein